MAITRRQFLKRTGLATAGTLLGPALFENPFVRRAMADGSSEMLHGPASIHSAVSSTSARKRADPTAICACR